MSSKVALFAAGLKMIDSVIISTSIVKLSPVFTLNNSVTPAAPSKVQLYKPAAISVFVPLISMAEVAVVVIELPAASST
jgi:hypothetical protein